MLTKVDGLILPDHSFLTPSDECYFLREYTARAGFTYNATNNLIQNFKKPVDRKGLPEWYYKGQAIQQIIRELRESLHPQWLEQATLVPIPPSSSKSDPSYDDRMIQVLVGLHPISRRRYDVRELIIQRSSTDPAHREGQSRNPETIQGNYMLDEDLLAPTPQAIGLFDDVLTSGAHFRAAQRLLVEHFPGVPIIGVFVARTVQPPPSITDI